jgi:3-methyladenine DNA glycosylase AlkD
MSAKTRDDVATLAADLAKRVADLNVRNTPALRGVRRELSRQLRHAPAETVLALARRLLQTPTNERRFFAYEFIHHHRAAGAELGGQELEEFGRGIDNWGAVDMFACYLAGPAWRAGQIPEGLIHQWARSADRWWRRAALVATVPLNNKTHGGAGDSKRTLAVCRLLLGDRDDMVVKAMSWALRELSKRDPNTVAAFLDRHRDEVAPRARREVGHKLRTGRKNPRAAP